MLEKFCPSSKMNFIDIFCGAGGLSCGLEMAGHKCLLGVDHNKSAINTFLRNHHDAEAFTGDIRKLDVQALKKLIKNQEVHCIVGGPPCQGFSTVGIGNPDDTRNMLFLEFVRIVREIRPPYIVVENVTGLLAKKNEKILKSILGHFEKLGYNLDVHVLAAQNYGVPEKRKRTIIIGSLLNEHIIFPEITHDAIINDRYVPPVTVGEALNDLFSDEKIFNHDIDAANIKSSLDKKRLKRIPEGAGIRYEKDEKAYFTPSLKLNVDWKNLPEGRFRQTKYQRLDRQKPSPTIMTHRHNYYHPIEHRFLTQREAAKIQSFPNDFVFEGALVQQWKQIGNAVPPLLGKAIGMALKKMYKVHLKSSVNQKEVKRKLSHNDKISTIRKGAFIYKEKKSDAQL